MMRLLVVFLWLSLCGMAQVVEKRTGEVATLTVCGATGDQVHFYRKTAVLGTPWRIGTKPRKPGVVECIDLRYLMPSGLVPQEFRFFAVPSKGTEFLDETNGVRVKRKL